MGRVRDGDRDCAGLLVRRYASALLTYVVRMIGNHDLGEELVQDVFLAVWEKRLQYQPQRPFRPWLYTIATNRCRLHFRRAKPTADFDEGLLEDAGGFDPASAADRAETQKIVAEAVPPSLIPEST